MSDDETLVSTRERRFGALGARADAEPERERQYLLVIEGETSQTFELPRTGEVAIGRGDTARLKLRDAGASRRHAVLTMAQGDARLEDAGSQNGTYLNGERVEEARTLSSADVITIGDASLVFHSNRRSSRRRPILEPEAFRRRVEEELERCEAAPDRTMAVVAVPLAIAE